MKHFKDHNPIVLLFLNLTIGNTISKDDFLLWNIFSMRAIRFHKRKYWGYGMYVCFWHMLNVAYHSLLMKINIFN